jgi:hypothetical protein
MPEMLIEKLKKAYVLAGNYSGGYSERFFGAEAFTKALGNAIKRLEDGDETALDDVFLW